MSTPLFLIYLVVIGSPTLCGVLVGWLLPQVLPMGTTEQSLWLTVGGVGLTSGLLILLWTSAKNTGVDEAMSAQIRRESAHAYPFQVAKLSFGLTLLITVVISTIWLLESRPLEEALVAGVMAYLLATPFVLLIYLALRAILRPIAAGAAGANALGGHRQTLRMRLLFAVQVPIVTGAIGLVLVEHQSSLGYAGEIQAYHQAQRAQIERQALTVLNEGNTVELAEIRLPGESNDIDWVVLLMLSLFVWFSVRFGRWLSDDVTDELVFIESTLKAGPSQDRDGRRTAIQLREPARLANALSGALQSLDRQRADLQSATDKRRMAEQEKARFLAHVSHELKSPLNSILGFSELLLARLDGPISSTQQEQIEKIWCHGDQLLRYILCLLDVARLDGVSARSVTKTDAAPKITTGREVLAALRAQKRTAPSDRISLKIVAGVGIDQTFTRLEPTQAARAALLVAGTWMDGLVDSGEVQVELKQTDQSLAIAISIVRGRLGQAAAESILKAWNVSSKKEAVFTYTENPALAVRLVELLCLSLGGSFSIEADGYGPRLIWLCPSPAAP